MAKAEFSYEVRKGATEPVWVEDYVVRTSDGESVGTVAAVLQHEGGRLLVVERGVVAVAQDRRVVPWSQVEQVDHDALAVWLRLDEATFLERADELDPDLAVEEGEAEATRVSVTPPGEIPPAQTQSSGPVDRPALAIAIFLVALTAFSALGVALAATAVDGSLPLLLGVVPAAFAIAAVVVGYRAYRNPYARTGAEKP